MKKPNQNLEQAEGLRKFRIFNKKYGLYTHESSYPNNQRTIENYFLNPNGKLMIALTCPFEGGVEMVEAGDDYVVEWSTGLQDVEGNEIYENDLIESQCLNTGYVKCIVGQDVWGIFYTKLENYPSEPYENCAVCAQEYNKVIGNINQNPECLKV